MSTIFETMLGELEKRNPVLHSDLVKLESDSRELSVREYPAILDSVPQTMPETVLILWPPPVQPTAARIDIMDTVSAYPAIPKPKLHRFRRWMRNYLYEHWGIR